MSNENLTEFKDRLKKIREYFNLTKEDFGISLNVSGAYIGQLESGKKLNPSKMFIDKLITGLGINQVWLESGQGEMFLPVGESTREYDLIYKPAWEKDPLIREMVAIMVDLDTDTRNDLLRQAKKEKKRLDLERKLEQMEGFTDKPRPLGADAKSKNKNIADQSSIKDLPS